MEMVSHDDLKTLCDFVNQKINPPNESGPHCNGEPCFAREFLQQIGQLDRLTDYLETGQATCDCTLLANYPGVFFTGDDATCHCCGEPILVSHLSAETIN